MPNIDRQPGGNRYWLGIGLNSDGEHFDTKASDQGLRQEGHFLPVNPNREDIGNDREQVPVVPEADSENSEFDFSTEFNKLWNQE